jgi:GGDEF domain-containing protein
MDRRSVDPQSSGAHAFGPPALDRSASRGLAGDALPTRVLTASERPAIHTTIARALALLGEGPRGLEGMPAWGPPSDDGPISTAPLELLRADSASETLAIATAQSPRVAFLDVTIGNGAGIGLVHFLQSIVPGLVVVAIVPEGVDQDVRLVEQAASLGASWVLLGELTGDDVLRAFGRVAPGLARSVPPPALGAPTLPRVEADFDADDGPQTRRGAALSDARSFKELDLGLGVLASGLPAADPRRILVDEFRAALERCLGQERSERATIQDATTSAYSFAYFVDLAGREIDLARRHGRRFALATVDISGGTLETRAMIELVLGAVRDTDVVARADEGELLLLLPETGSKGARTLRRRILDRVQSLVGQGRPPPIRVGVASFPFDGEDLSRLLRIARRRAERWSPWDASFECTRLLGEAIAWLGRGHRPGALPNDHVGPLVPIEVPLRDGWALFDTIVREATRGGDATIAIHATQDGSEPSLGLAQGVRASTLDAMGPLASATAMPTRAERDRDVLSLMTGVSRLTETAPFAGLEVLAVLAEHACYGLVGRVEDGRLVALHGHDLPIVEALVNGLEQPIFRRGIISGTSSSAAPSSVRSSRSDPMGLRPR